MRVLWDCACCIGYMDGVGNTLQMDGAGSVQKMHSVNRDGGFRSTIVFAELILCELFINQFSTRVLQVQFEMLIGECSMLGLR